MNSYDLTRRWFDFAFETTECKAQHTALYMWIIELNNRLGWKRQFGLPARDTMEGLSIGNRNTFFGALRDLDKWGFIRIIKEAKNQYQSCIIELCRYENEPALVSALDTALIRHCSSTDTGTGLSTGLGTVPIDKPRNKETKKQRNQETDDDSCEFVAVEVDEIENPVSEKKEKTSTPSSARPPSPKKSESLHARLREEIEIRNPDYYWTGKDGKALTGIISRIKYRWKKRNGEDPDDQEIIKSFIWFLDRLPQWYRDKWDTAVLSSKFDAIMSEIKANTQNGKVNNNFGNQYEPSDRLREAFELTERANAAGASKRGAFGTG